VEARVTQLGVFVFGELVEGSATLSKLGEARSERARRAYLEVVRSAVAAAGGREMAGAGDGVLAAFESATAGLRFACAVLRGCDRESRRSSERLDVRLGIDIGEFSPDDGSIGEDVVAALRARQLARAADAGRVLATGVVSALVTGPDHRFKPAGLLELSGSAAPVPVMEMEWERPVVTQAPLPPELDSAGPRTSFVGRASEQERLREVWRRALGGVRQLAFVLGEPGIGKTRLVTEFARELYEQGVGVLWGRSLEEALTPYQPFVQALQHHVRSAPLEDLREQVAIGADELARLLPELRARLRLSGASVEEPAGGRYRLFEAVSELLAAASAERPILLVLDDLQWADQGTLLLLKHLARDPSPAPLLLLGTYRQSEVGRDHPLALTSGDVERDHIVERIELAGLGQDEVAILVGGLIGWVPSTEVARSLYGETEGNPLFLEEVVRHLEHLGLNDPERLAAVQSAVPRLGVPARVRELVSRRVQRLSQPTRTALSTAAAIGSEFDSDVLAEVLEFENEREFVEALDEAVEGQLLVESGERVGRYSFSHALIHQALYEELTLNRRALLHEQIGTALEALRSDEPDAHAEIAAQYGRAGTRQAAKVVRHGRAAGEYALGSFAYEDAIRELSKALDALAVTGDDPCERAELLTLLGTAQTRAGDVAAAQAAFQRAAELSTAAGAWQTLVRAALGYGGWTGFGGLWESFQTVDAGLVGLLEQALATCPPGDSHERVRLLGRLAQALYWSPETERALRLSDEALVTARRLGDPAALAYALDSRNVVLWGPDHLDEGRELAKEMLLIGRELGDRDIQLEALLWLIPNALERGSIHDVDELIDEYARIASELRQPYHLWFTDALRAMRAHLDGRFDEAFALSERAYAYGEQAHGPNALNVRTAQALFLWLDQGRVESLLHEVERLDLEWGSSPLVHVARALVLAGLDRREEALAQVALVAEQGLTSIPRDALWELTIVNLGRTVGHFDDPAYADELYELLLPFADRVCVLGGGVLCLGPASRILGMLARARGKPELAIEHFAYALDRSRALGSPPLVARTQLESAKAHLMRGSAADAAAAERLLDEASIIASNLGMAKVSRDIDAWRSSARGSPA
jgi:class 3 adenylate cyclase/tetratricopeptide (TPR) repeat protein